MAWQVVLAESAKADADQIYEWVVERAPLRGPEWFEEMLDHLYSLRELPHRCPVARESRSAKSEVRCLLFGRRRNAWRILYEIDEPSATVRILHIRRGAMSDGNTLLGDRP